jgi:hypothetical protein
MTNMDKIWIATALLINPNTSNTTLITRQDIEKEIWNRWGTKITPVMLGKHLVSWEASKRGDSQYDGWDKTGPLYPQKNKIDPQYHYLVDWYINHYC